MLEKVLMHKLGPGYSISRKSAHIWRLRTMQNDLELDFCSDEAMVVAKWVLANRDCVKDIPYWLDPDWATALVKGKRLSGYYWTRWVTHEREQKKWA